MVCLRIEDFRQENTSVSPGSPPSGSCLCKWSHHPFPHLSGWSSFTERSPSVEMLRASSNSAPHVHFCLACSFSTLQYSFHISLFILQDWIQTFAALEKSFWLCTSSTVYPVLVSGTTLTVQSYIFTCIDSTTHKQKQTYFSCSMAPPWEPSSSSGAELRKLRSVSMLRVCDHTACESCPESLQLIL